MAVLDVKNIKGEAVSTVELPDAIFNVPVKAEVLHQVVTMQLANKRSQTASVKHRSDVRGSTRKLYRQKGTGRARRGDVKSPLLRGGGVIFGPDNRNYRFTVPKKIRKLALKMALSSKLTDDALLVLDAFSLSRIKTRDFVQALKDLSVKSALIVTDQKDETLERSSRNVPEIKLLRVEGLNVYDVMKYQTLILLEASIPGIQGRLSS
ncbi:MAG: 50S ribosomal protein L4 [Deltaproteobacteria bacterium]|nr:50S ribosomal protein L4 [Deltaproteobacteria bacterium]MBW1955702.1 50S ribosomal protein L4 [Deltaproteobacteria bacterium]MBW2041396.1 50S ribosomal protein L4 [Deltaproteobacteria bacterium]MBW2133070.1 50S ribosomal protein L4 [Deltaproteobacteria bacterium]